MFSITESLLVASTHVTFYFPPKCILLFMLIIYRHLEKTVQLIHFFSCSVSSFSYLSSLTPTSSEEVLPKVIYKATKNLKDCSRMRARKKKTAMFHSDEVRVSLVRRRNEPRLQRAKLRFPPIKTRNHRLTPTIVKRQLCLQGSALTRRWTLISCLQLIVRALITSDKEKHKSQGEA